MSKMANPCSILKRTLLVSAAVVAAQSAGATDLFSLTATGGAPTTTATGNSVIDLFYEAVNAQNQFSAFSNVPLNANLNYAGIPNAILIQAPAPLITSASATVIIPSINFSQTFNGPDRASVEKQIEDFFKKNGSTILAGFMKTVSAKSPVSPVDGNPGSATAATAFQTYANFGMTFGETKEEQDAPKESTGHFGVGVVADVGTFDANGFKGTSYSLPLYARAKITDRIGLTLDLPITYSEIESAKVFGVGANLGISYKIIPHSKSSPWYWQVTPSGGANLAASKDFLAGGLIASGGFTSLASYDFSRCTLSMGNHVSFHEGVPVAYDSYTFDPGVSQQIIKNGLKLDVPVGRRWIVDVYAVHTKFLGPAAVNQYATIGGEIGYRMLGKSDSPKKKNGYVKLGIYSDVGSNYTSAHVQFGSGWKF